MADRPDGFTLLHSKRAPRRYYKGTDAGIIAVGDPVIKQTNTADPEGYNEIVRATTGAAITGVVVAIEPVLTDLSRHGYLASAETGYVLVCDDPDAEYVVQDNGGATGMSLEDIGQHIDSVAALDADTTLQRSKYEIDTEAKATDNTWYIDRLYDVVDKDTSSLVNARWVVKPNLHTERNASATNITEV